jgi:hypothetical protein
VVDVTDSGAGSTSFLADLGVICSDFVPLLMADLTLY